MKNCLKIEMRKKLREIVYENEKYALSCFILLKGILLFVKYNSMKKSYRRWEIYA